MKKQDSLLPIILCGGSGSRLWPLSRKSYPKQYLKINPKNKYTFLQNTLIRIKALENICDPVIVCNEEHRFITAEQIRDIDIKPQSILLEPLSRNTAPAVAIAALNSISNGDDPILFILPADHQIKNCEKFLESIKDAQKHVTNGKIILFGIKPHFPSTAYGYIKINKKLSNENHSPYQIESFIEKPEKSLANKFFKDELFTWNSGIFMARASTIISELNRYYPEIIFQCKKSLENKIMDLDFIRLGKKYFEKCPSISLDKAVMEKTELGLVFPLDAEWSDIGGWESFWENTDKDNDNNLVIGNAIQFSSKNSLISSYSRLTVALGIDNLIIVETNDAVLIAKKDQSEKVKDLVNNLKQNNYPESEQSKKVHRPWGNYFCIEEDSNWKIKRIEVKPGESLSLQLHKKRAEHWIVVKGIANIEIKNKIFTLYQNQSCFIPKGEKHRLSNFNEEDLVMIEVQSGEYLGEDDIIRFDDVYGRK